MGAGLKEAHRISALLSSLRLCELLLPMGILLPMHLVSVEEEKEETIYSNGKKRLRSVIGRGTRGKGL